MEEQYLRLDCRIKRYNRMNPASFIIDAEREPPAAAVFDRRSHESLDHRKGQGPRPLKTHAYNFSYIEDEQGQPLVRERASNREEAEAFAEAVIKAAQAISREAYLEELDRIIWPPYSKEEPGMRNWQSRVRALQTEPAEMRLYDSRVNSLIDNLELPVHRSITQYRNVAGDPDLKAAGKAHEKSDRKSLAKEVLRLMEQMDRDDLRSLCRYARMLLDE